MKVLFWILYIIGASVVYYFLTITVWSVGNFLLYGRFRFSLVSPTYIITESPVSVMWITAFLISFVIIYLLYRRFDISRFASIVILVSIVVLLVVSIATLKVIDLFGSGGFGLSFIFSLLIIYFILPFCLSFFTHFIGLGILKNKLNFLS